MEDEYILISVEDLGAEITEASNYVLNQIKASIEEAKNNAEGNLIARWLKKQGYNPRLLTPTEISKFKSENYEALIAITDFCQSQLESLRNIRKYEPSKANRT